MTQMIEIINSFRLDYCPNTPYTPNRPLEWVKECGMAPARLGAFGKIVVRQFLTDNGFSVDDYSGRDVDFTVDGRRVASKLSTLWERDVYRFQQIRDDNYEFLFCLGISPGIANIWVARKSEIVWGDLQHQHRGEIGVDTWWITFTPPSSPHTWMHPQNGDPSAICEHLRRMLSEES